MENTKTHDPQEAPLILLNLIVWGFVCYALLGPLSRWTISEILFYVAQERFLLSILEFMALAEPTSKRDILKFRAFYWIVFSAFYLSRYFVINKPKDYIEHHPELWDKWDYWPPMRPD